MRHTFRKLFANLRLGAGRAGRRLAPAGAAAALALALVCGTVSKAGSATVDPAILAAAKSLEAKLALLGSKDSQPSASYRAVVITQYEVNSYMKVHSGDIFPKGVHTPTMSMEPDHLSASADVNFDELSRSDPNPKDMGPKILAAMFHGTERATVTAKIQSAPAGVMVQIDTVQVGSTTVPTWLVNYVIQNVLQPEYKFDLSKPQPYPDHVTRMVLGSRQVTFLRGAKGPRKNSFTDSGRACSSSGVGSCGG